MSGCSSGVEHNLAKVGVERSNRFTRSISSQNISELRPLGPRVHVLPFGLGSTWAAPARLPLRRLSIALALCGLAGCQTNAEHQANVNASLDARLEAYTGRSMAEFIGRTGMQPESSYDVSEGRVFVFRTSPVYVTLPATHVTPAVTTSAQCQLLIRAVRTSPELVANSWKIMGTQRQGPCNNLPV
jgi:hypothetical protein